MSIGLPASHLEINQAVIAGKFIPFLGVDALLHGHHSKQWFRRQARMALIFYQPLVSLQLISCIPSTLTVPRTAGLRRLNSVALEVKCGPSNLHPNRNSPSMHRRHVLPLMPDPAYGILKASFSA
jgi:hypothetical protein